MPSTRVYFVDFANGNLTPSFNPLNWPDMRPGGSNLNPASAMPQRPDPSGLIVETFRGGRVTGEASNSVYVMPNNLPVESRLLLTLQFDSPSASGNFDDQHAWAVDLKVKKPATVVDDLNEAVAVTCQFRTADGQSGVGVRLNTPFTREKDNRRTATNLLTSDDYTIYQPPLDGTSPVISFVLQHLFCGVGAVSSPGYAVGCGFLNIGNSRPIPNQFRGVVAIDQADMRVFSHDSVWPTVGPVEIGGGPFIGALGVSVITLTGEGTMSARLRTFSVDLWPLGSGEATNHLG